MAEFPSHSILIAAGWGKAPIGVATGYVGCFCNHSGPPRNPPFRIAQLDQIKADTTKTTAHHIYRLSQRQHPRQVSHSWQDHESNLPFLYASKCAQYYTQRQHHGRKMRLHLAESQPAQEKQMLPLQNSKDISIPTKRAFNISK